MHLIGGKKAGNALKNEIISKHHKARNHQQLKSNKQWKPGVISTWRVHSWYSRHFTKGIFIHIWENAWIHVLWWRLVEKIDISWILKLCTNPLEQLRSISSILTFRWSLVSLYFVFLFIHIHSWHGTKCTVSRFTKQLFLTDKLQKPWIKLSESEGWIWLSN